MVNGITFSEQLITSENFAHFMYTFLNHANGVTKGCGISNANGKVYVQKGYFIVFGRMVQIIGTEEIASPDVVSGQLYCKVVFEVDLSKENTAEEFIQGAFKTLTSTSGYPSVKQEDLDNSGKVYQMPWCQYIKQAGSIKDFRDLREILNLNSIWSAISSQNTQYKGEFDDYFALQRSTILGMIKELEGHGYATTAEFSTLSKEVADTKKSVSDGKAEIAAAITLKRVTTAASATFHQMAENIKKIVLGSGNAQKGNVLAGKTFTNDDGVQYTGEMPERGSKNITLPINGSQDLPAGHYDGIHIGQSIATLGGQTITPGANQQTVSSSGKYMTGNVVVNAVANLLAANIKRNVKVGGITGTCDWAVSLASEKVFETNVDIVASTLYKVAQGSSKKVAESGPVHPEYPYLVVNVVITHSEYDFQAYIRSIGKGGASQTFFAGSDSESGSNYAFICGIIFRDSDGALDVYLASTLSGMHNIKVYVEGATNADING